MAPQKPRHHSKPKRRSRPSSGDPLLDDLHQQQQQQQQKQQKQQRQHRSYESAEDESSDARPRRTTAQTTRRSAAVEIVEARGKKKRPKGQESGRSGGQKDGAVRGKERRYTSSKSESSNALSLAALARLDAMNEKAAIERVRKEKMGAGRVAKDVRPRGSVRRTKRRVVSGPLLEEGRKMEYRGGSGGDDEESGWSKKKKPWVLAGVVVVLLLILIPVGVVVAGKQSGGGGGSSDGSAPANANLKGVSAGSIPPSAKGGLLDPFTWYDTTDFNVSYTEATVGGLSLMGLNTTWDDSTRANEYVPPLNESFKYGQMPIRGINLGGWLSIEPFITPSLFDSYDAKLNIIDEYSLCAHLGSTSAAQVLEKHYASFINRQSFADIQAAGFDHVRLPYAYWAVATYPGDPYVPKISWRYLLRGIEYARLHGLRVNLDLHALPGSQNGWNHSGRQGPIGWLNGTDGALNGQRSLDLHGQLATFFAQPRYQHVVGLYGLVNEPKMTRLVTADVLAWTQKAIDVVRGAGLAQPIVVGDGFLGLPNWQGKLQGVANVVLDAHQYVIFNQQQIAFTHQTKLNYACSGWSGQMRLSVNTASGFGPTLCGEWSQADTDCAPNLNNYGAGSRWTGTMDLGGDPSLNVLKPSCPPNAGACQCSDANADASHYSDAYKRWLLLNAEAQMASFEIGWGWFYWTWLTEGAVQWSWKLGMEAGILPAKVWQRDFNCSSAVPEVPGLPENY